MKILTKRQWVSWLRLSLLVFIAHITILGLIHDWEIFSSKNYYPLILDGFNFPFFYFTFLLYRKKVKQDKNSLPSVLTTGALMSIAFVVSLNLPETVFKEESGPGTLIAALFFLWFAISIMFTFECSLKQAFMFGTGIWIITGLCIGFFMGIGTGFVLGFYLWVACTLGAVLVYSIKMFFISKFSKNIFNWFMAKKIEG